MPCRGGPPRVRPRHICCRGRSVLRPRSAEPRRVVVLMARDPSFTHNRAHDRQLQRLVRRRSSDVLPATRLDIVSRSSVALQSNWNWSSGTSTARSSVSLRNSLTLRIILAVLISRCDHPKNIGISAGGTDRPNSVSCSMDRWFCRASVLRDLTIFGGTF